MSIRRISPQQARELMEQQGYLYVDVRSEVEFERGHPAGAYNAPIAHMGPAGMSPNPDFTSVMQARFGKDAKLVLGCQAGGRSLHAAGLLESLGFSDVVDQRAGWGGAAGEPGWAALGLPAETEAPAERSWKGLALEPAE